MLHNKYLCIRHFLESDFTTAERLHLNRVSSTVTPIPIYADSPSTSFQMSAVQPSPTAANIFAVRETSFPLSCVNINASVGELRHINCQSSPKAFSAKRT
jgi:hypothetical protein